MTRLGAALFSIVLFLCGNALAAPGRALDDAPPGDPPAVAREIDIEEHLGQPVNRDLWFTDDSGHRVQLSSYFEPDRPVLLILAYFRCPMLCGLVLHGVVDGLKGLDWRPGERYRVLTVSFDPHDTPEGARNKRASTVAALGGPPPTDRAWPFLVGGEAEIRSLASDLGFRFAYDPRTDQYAHPAAAFVLTPDGRISRYLYGISYPSRDLRLALLEASAGKIGTIVDRVIMSCYRYDPATRRYGPFLVGFMRIGGALTLAVLSALLAVLWLGERRRRLSAEGGAP